MYTATRSLVRPSNINSHVDLHKATADDLIARYLGKKQVYKYTAKIPDRDESTASDLLLQIVSSVQPPVDVRD